MKDQNFLQIEQTVSEKKKFLNVDWNTLKPHFILAFLIIEQFIVYLDKGVIAGAHEEILHFISRTVNDEEKKYSKYLGFLNTSFVLGLCFASPVFARLTHRICSIKLISYGLLLFCISLIIAGCAPMIDSFWLLLVGRSLGGIGEAAILSLVPPLIIKFTNGAHVGLWMGTLCSIIPVGIALGFVYSAAIANTSLKWNGSFFVTMILLLPFLFVTFAFPKLFEIEGKSTVDFISDRKSDTETTDDNASKAKIDPCNPENNSLNGSKSHIPQNDNNIKSYFAILGEIFYVLKSIPFLCVSVCFAAFAAHVGTLALYGVIYLRNLKFATTQMQASLTIGMMSVITGIVGSILGGIICAYCTREKPTDNLTPTTNDNKNIDTQFVLTYPALCHVRKIFFWLIPTSVIAFGASFIAAYAQTAVVYVVGSSIVLIFLFIAQTFMQLSAMLSVPVYYQSTATAVVTCLLHFLGDVPAPVILGVIKDYLAPPCAEVSENITQIEECFKYQSGIRFSLVLLNLWLGWVVIGAITGYFVVKYKLSVMKQNHEKKLFDSQLTSDCNISTSNQVVI